MSFTVPTLQQSIERRQADLALRAGKETFPVNDQAVLARTFAGMENGLYGHQAFIASQIVPDKAEDEYLIRFANWWGVPRKPAATASGSVRLTGNAGAVIDDTALLQRQDGVRFRVTKSASLVDGTALVSLEAETPGKVGNTPAGVKLAAVSAVEGVRGDAVVEVEIAGGADEETIDALRARLRARVQKPPMGGAAYDWHAWVLEVPGVTRAWVYPRRMGLGTVSVTFVMDDIDGGPIPPPEIVAAMEAYLNAPVRKPVACELFVFAPVPEPLTFVIANLSPDTPAVRAAVEAELRDLLTREAEPGGYLFLSHIREAISRAPGETDHYLVFPDDDVAPEFGRLPVFGGIEWVRR